MLQLQLCQQPRVNFGCNKGSNSSCFNRKRILQKQVATVYNEDEQYAVNRRWMVKSGGLFLFATFPAFPAFGGMNNYIKSKPLDPLSTYVPPVLVAQEQLQGLKLELSDPDLTVDAKSVRDMLRSGSFSGLRSDIRAIMQYAQEDGRIDDDGNALIRSFLTPLERLDSKLLAYVRNGQNVGKEIEEELNQASDGLSGILGTLPRNVLERASEVVDQKKPVPVTSEERDQFLETILQ